ncbi:MAG: hypothetical protein JWO05_1609 [Gemmatimonadetes bacterium]|nr:hypothetical protein [Gemmatimonadota bacterium]
MSRMTRVLAASMLFVVAATNVHGQLSAAPQHATKAMPVSHGSWTRGPGTYTLTVCAQQTCDIHGSAGQTVGILVEAWGGGGGGGTGSSSGGIGPKGGSGGGGGGGGAYGSYLANIPLQTAVLTLSVVVGAGGGSGSVNSYPATPAGDGVASYVQYTAGIASGLLIKAGGGVHGASGPRDQNVAGGAAGITVAGTSGTLVPGTAGGQGPASTSCVGADGGTGGAGGGPGNINKGGGGGHGGYFRSGSSCGAQVPDFGRAAGTPGGNGRVTLSW